MATHDQVLGDLAILFGLASPTQVEAAFDDLRHTPGTPLSEILKRQEVVSEQQLQLLLSMEEATFWTLGTDNPRPAAARDVVVAKALIETGQVDEGSIRTAYTRLRQLAARRDPPPDLGEVLVEGGLVMEDTLQSLLADLDERQFTCAGCGNRFHLPNHLPSDTYACPACGGRAFSKDQGGTGTKDPFETNVGAGGGPGIYMSAMTSATTSSLPTAGGTSTYSANLTPGANRTPDQAGADADSYSVPTMNAPTGGNIDALDAGEGITESQLRKTADDSSVALPPTQIPADSSAQTPVVPVEPAAGQREDDAVGGFAEADGDPFDAAEREAASGDAPVPVSDVFGGMDSAEFDGLSDSFAASRAAAAPVDQGAAPATASQADADPPPVDEDDWSDWGEAFQSAHDENAGKLPGQDWNPGGGALQRDAAPAAAANADAADVADVAGGDPFEDGAHFESEATVMVVPEAGDAAEFGDAPEIVETDDVDTFSGTGFTPAGTAAELPPNAMGGMSADVMTGDPFSDAGGVDDDDPFGAPLSSEVPSPLAAAGAGAAAKAPALPMGDPFAAGPASVSDFPVQAGDPFGVEASMDWGGGEMFPGAPSTDDPGDYKIILPDDPQAAPVPPPPPPPNMSPPAMASGGPPNIRAILPGGQSETQLERSLATPSDGFTFETAVPATGHVFDVPPQVTSDDIFGTSTPKFDAALAFDSNELQPVDQIQLPPEMAPPPVVSEQAALLGEPDEPELPPSAGEAHDRLHATALADLPDFGNLHTPGRPMAVPPGLRGAKKGKPKQPEKEEEVEDEAAASRRKRKMRHSELLGAQEFVPEYADGKHAGEIVKPTPLADDNPEDEDEDIGELDIAGILNELSDRPKRRKKVRRRPSGVHHGTQPAPPKPVGPKSIAGGKPGSPQESITSRDLAPPGKKTTVNRVDAPMPPPRVSDAGKPRTSAEIMAKPVLPDGARGVPPPPPVVRPGMTKGDAQDLAKIRVTQPETPEHRPISEINAEESGRLTAASAGGFEDDFGMLDSDEFGVGAAGVMNDDDLPFAPAGSGIPDTMMAAGPNAQTVDMGADSGRVRDAMAEAAGADLFSSAQDFMPAGGAADLLSKFAAEVAAESPTAPPKSAKKARVTQSGREDPLRTASTLIDAIRRGAPAQASTPATRAAAAAPASFPGPEAAPPAPEPALDSAEAALSLAQEQAAHEALGGRTHIGPYFIQKELGRGGMGIVFKARHRRLGRIVALKTILGDAASNPDVLKRFEKEARAVANLHHPNITGLYEMEQDADSGIHYLAMEFVEGLALDKYVEESKPVMQQRLAVLVQVAEALAYAHDRNILHRDIKPGNILITPAGQAKLTDFGLAKELDSTEGDAHKLTRTGQIMGTPAYMSPEQAKGDIHELDPRSDQFSLGILAYELVSGTNPFAEETSTVFQVLARVCTHEPPLLRTLVKDLPDGVENVVFKMLEKGKEGRYPTLHGAVEDLRRARKGERVEARKQSGLLRLRKFVGRHKVAVSLLTITLLLLATAGGLYYQLVYVEEQRAILEAAAEKERIETLTAERGTELAKLDAAYRGDNAGEAEAIVAALREKITALSSEATPQERALIGWYLAHPRGGNDPDAAMVELQAAVDADTTLADAWLAIADIKLRAGDEAGALVALESAADAAEKRAADITDPIESARVAAAPVLKQLPIRERQATDLQERHDSLGPTAVSVSELATVWSLVRDAADRALTHMPDDAGALAYRGLALGLLGEAAAAKDALDASLVKDDSRALTHLFRARVALAEQRFEDALYDNATALRLDPTLPGLFDQREAVERADRETDLDALRDAIAAAATPADALPSVVLAIRLLIKAGQPQAALDLVIQHGGEAQQPGEAPALALARAHVYEAIGEQRAAVRAYEQAAASGDADALREAGLNALDRGDRAHAAEWLAAAQQLAPNDVRIAIGKARLSATQGSAASAIRTLARNTVSRDYLPAMLTLGDLYLQNGQTNAALQQWRQVASASMPTSPGGDLDTSEYLRIKLHAAARIYTTAAAAGDTEMQDAAFADLFGQHPDPALVFVARATARHEVGDRAGAAADMEQAMARVIEFTPSYGVYRDVHLANAELLTARGNAAVALDAYTALARALPDDRVALSRALQLALDLGRTDTAREHADAEQQRWPNSLVTLEDRIALAVRTGAHDSSTASIDALSQRDSTHPMLPLWRAALTAPSSEQSAWVLTAPTDARDDSSAATAALTEARRRLGAGDAAGALAVVAPYDEPARSNLDASALAARAMTDLGNTRGALRVFERVRIDERMRAQDWMQLLSLAARQGDSDAVAEARAALQQQAPGCMALLELAARDALARRNWIEASARFEAMFDLGLAQSDINAAATVARRWLNRLARGGDRAVTLAAANVVITKLAGIVDVDDDASALVRQTLAEIYLIAGLHADEPLATQHLDRAAAVVGTQAGSLARVLADLRRLDVDGAASRPDRLAIASLALSTAPLPEVVATPHALVGLYVEMLRGERADLVERARPFSIEFVRIKWLRALALLDLGRVDDARAELGGLRDADLDDRPYAHLVRALALASQGQLETALLDVGGMLDRQSDAKDPAALMVYGRLLFEAERYVDARDMFRAALDSGDARTATAARMGVVLSALAHGEAQVALAAVDELSSGGALSPLFVRNCILTLRHAAISRRDPGSTIPVSASELRNLARQFISRLDTESPAYWLETGALKADEAADPTAPASEAERAEAMIEAEDAFARAAALDPGSATVALYRARALLADDRPQDALAACQAGLALDAASGELYLVRATANRLLGNSRQALGDLKTARDFQHTPKALAREAIALAQASPPAVAMRVLDTVLDYASSNVDVLLLHMVASATIGDLERTRADAQRLAALYPDDMTAPRWLVYLALRSDDLALARQPLAELLTRGDGDAWTRGAAAYADLLEGVPHASSSHYQWLEARAAEAADAGEDDGGAPDLARLQHAGYPAAWLAAIALRTSDDGAGNLLAWLDASLAVIDARAVAGLGDNDALTASLSYNRAVWHHRRGETAAAEAAVGEVIRRDPDSRSARLLRVVQMAGDAARADLALRELGAMWSNSQDPLAVHAALWCVTRHGKAVPRWIAIAAQQLATEDAEAGAAAFAALGAAHFRTARLAAATAAWQRALELSPRMLFLRPHIDTQIKAVDQ